MMKLNEITTPTSKELDIARQEADLNEKTFGCVIVDHDMYFYRRRIAAQRQVVTYIVSVAISFFIGLAYGIAPIISAVMQTLYK